MTNEKEELLNFYSKFDGTSHNYRNIKYTWEFIDDIAYINCKIKGKNYHIELGPGFKNPSDLRICTPTAEAYIDLKLEEIAFEEYAANLQEKYSQGKLNEKLLTETQK